MATLPFLSGIDMKLFHRSKVQTAPGGAQPNLVERVMRRLNGDAVVSVAKPMSADMSGIYNLLMALQDGKRDLETWMTGVTAVWDSTEVEQDVSVVREWTEAVDQAIERMRATLLEKDVSLPPPSRLDMNTDRTAARNLAAGSLQAHCAFLNVFFVKKDVGYLALSRLAKVVPMSLLRISYAAQYRRISADKVRSAALPEGLTDGRIVKRIGSVSPQEDRALAAAAQRAAATKTTIDAT